MKNKGDLLKILNILIETLGNRKKFIQDLTALNLFLLAYIALLLLLSTFFKPISTLVDISLTFFIAIGMNFGNLIQGKKEYYIPKESVGIKFASFLNDFENLLLYTYGKLFLVMIIMTFLTMLIIVIVNQTTKKRVFILIFNIDLLILISVISFTYKNIFISFLLGLVLLSIVLILQPVGTGLYYKILKRIYYLSITNSGLKVKPSALKITMLFFVILIIIIIFHIYLPNVSKVIPITLSLSIIILVGSESLKKESYRLTVKLVFYLLIIPVIIISNSTKGISIESILLVTITIYFSIERIITISKKIEGELREHNVHFNMNEYEDNYDKERIIKELIPVEHLEHVLLKEDEFVSQLVKYFHIRNEGAVIKLIDIYRRNENYSHYDDLITCFTFVLNYYSATEKEQYKFLKNHLKFDNQKLLPIDLIEKYVFLWDEFEKEKNYQQMIYLLQSNYALISEESINKLEQLKTKAIEKENTKSNSSE